jgi:hypothetical protein
MLCAILHERIHFMPRPLHDPIFAIKFRGCLVPKISLEVTAALAFHEPPHFDTTCDDVSASK